jgi:hypothetical protein
VIVYKAAERAPLHVADLLKTSNHSKAFAASHAVHSASTASTNEPPCSMHAYLCQTAEQIKQRDHDIVPHATPNVYMLRA